MTVYTIYIRYRYVYNDRYEDSQPHVGIIAQHTVAVLMNNVTQFVHVPAQSQLSTTGRERVPEWSRKHTVEVTQKNGDRLARSDEQTHSPGTSS